MPEIEKLYSVVKDNGLYTKSYDEFVGKYSNEQNMSKLYQVVSDQGLYTKSFDDFKGKYFSDLKKKESVSPSQQKQQPTSSATGATSQGGASAPSQRKKYTLSKADADLNKRITASQQVLKPSSLPPEEAMAMAPMMGEVAETSQVITPKKDEGYFGGVGRILAGGATKEEAKQAVIPGPKYELEYKGEKVETDIVNKAIATTYKILGNLAGTPNFAYDVTKASMGPVQKATLMNALEPVMGQLREANIPEKALKAKAKEMESKMQKVEGDVSDRFSRGDYADGFRLLSNELASSAPQMLGVMLSGGGPAGMILLGLSSAEMRADDLEGQDITDREKYANALAYGGAEVLFELVGAGPMARVTKNIIKREGPVVGKEIVKKGILDVVDDLTVKYPMLFGSSAEGLSEMATTIAQNAADKYGGIDPERDLMEGTADAFIAGNAMGLGLGGVVKLAQTILPQDKRDQVVKNQQDILKAKEIILDPNISEEKRTALQQLVNKKIQDNENLQRKAFEKLSFIPEDVRKEYASLRSDAMDLQSEIESEVDPIIKEALELELQTRKLQIKKIEEYAVQEQTTSEVPVQPETAVGGEVAQGEPKAESEVAAEEGQKEVVSGIEITYPTQQQRAEREAVRNSQEYVNAKAVELPKVDLNELADDLQGDFAMVTGENPKGQPLTEEENQALNQKAQDWLASKGYDPKPLVGKFNQAENSFFVKGMTQADAIEFAKEFNQESVAHSSGMVYQDGSINPRTEGDDFSFRNFEPGMNMVSIVNTDNGPKQFSVAYDFETTIQPEATTFDKAVNNSAQSLKMVAPDLKVIVAENNEDAQLQIAEAISSFAPSQATSVAEGFTTEVRGQTIFVDGKPFAIVLDKAQANSRTAGHEAWEVLLNDAFGDDQAKFKEFRDEIDRQLRLNGFGDIADELTKFSNQRGYEDVKYSEYMAELGGMLFEAGFKEGSLDAKQKSLLQKIGDIINKFAQLFTGKKQFLDEATPDDILSFMTTISTKMAKGEDVSQFFRGKTSEAKPSVDTRSQKAAIEILDGPKFDNKLKEDVATFLNGLRESEIPPNSTREQLMERFINNVYEEVGYYLYSKPDARSTGLTWYIEDMVEFANKVKVILPELSDDNQYKLFLSVLAFTSSGTNPNQNLLYAYNLWNNSKNPKNFEFSKNWAEKKLSFIDKKGKPVASGTIVKETAKEYTVELVDSLGRPVVDSKGNKKYEKVSKASMKPGYPKPTGYTNRGEIIVGQLEKLEKLYADLGSIDAVVKWLETPHPIAELRKYNESVPDVNGKGPGKTNKQYDPNKNAEGERNGAFIFGEKIGSFYQNMIGIGETITMDLWWSRTWNRYMGTMINTVSGKKEIQEVPRSDRERNIMREAVKMVAEDLNLQVSELQAAIWYFEQELWTKSGNESPSYSYVTAIDDLTKKLKVDEETRSKLRAAEADLTEAEKRRQNAAERAAAVVARKGGEGSGAKVTTKSQKSVPDVVDEVLTDDGKGNYLFVHYSDEKRDTIKPMSGSKKGFTSRDEVAAISSVGGVAMYYTKQGQKEQGVGDVPHTVLVPKDKVYFYGTTERGKVSNDPENFEPEARRRFQEYKNRGNQTRPTEYAFDANNAAAWVSKVAAENGYDMVVTNWGGPTGYRAQTVKELTPESEYTGFKQIPEPKYEVGDEVFLYGQYVTLTDVKPDVLTYETEAGSGKYPLTVMTRDKIIMIKKANPVITARAQKKSNFTTEEYKYMSQNGVLFHGGNQDIAKLDPSKIKGGMRAVYGWGVYFAGTIGKASDYGDMITFLNSNKLNLLKITGKITDGLLKELESTRDNNIYYGLFLDKLNDMTGTNINEARLRMGDFIRWDYDKLWSQMFLDAGYDGFNQGDYEYVIFNIDKANEEILDNPMKVTTKSQKVEVKTIPGYDRMMKEVDGILDKTMNRTGSYNQATANAIGYIQKSAVYQRADDSQREQIIRDFVKLRGEKIKVAPSVAKLMGEIKDVKTVTVKEKTALKDQIKLEAKAAKDAVAFVKQLRNEVSNAVKLMVGRGVISAKQAASILSKYDRINILNPVMRDRFVDYMENVFRSADYADRLREANGLRKAIKKAAKSKDNQAESTLIAKKFAEIDPSRVENIDQYTEMATNVLNSVSRKTGKVKMRDIVNMEDMISYMEDALSSQDEMIKNELLAQNQYLVDAGVLSEKMTINEIKKIVAAIEEKESNAEEKAKESMEALKTIMGDLSPILKQIVRTGEDPFTGLPVDLTQDERTAIIGLANMDLSSLSLSDAVKVVEYAQNFIANNVTSGVQGMVSLYEGSLEPAKLEKKGFKSIRLRKYFSPGAGRAWAESFASIPMLNKLMWGDTTRANIVANASGTTGIANGKAKALKIVDNAVKQYIAKFSKTKDFLAAENVLERGVVAFMSRAVIGDQFQVQEEFNRRKKLIEQTIVSLKDEGNSTDAEIAKGEVLQKVYDKVLKDARSAEDVRSKSKPINVEAVDWWINEWSKHYERMDEISRGVYNTALPMDINYTPDRFQLKEVPTAKEEDFESGFFGNFEYVNTSKSGSLRENNRIKDLPQDKNGVKTRIVNLDFDVNNVNALTNALVDIETASSVMRMKGFLTSKDYAKMFSNKEDKDLYKKRLVNYVNRAKGGSYIDQGELAKMNRIINAIASFGVAKALFSAAQPFKQFNPPMMNTLVQTGRFDVNQLMRGAMGFIDRSGYPIANRGISSQGELKSINRKLVEAEKNLALRGVDGIAELSNAALEVVLKYPDVFAARASWISFYLYKLNKLGEKTSGINWETHELNKEAADYAQSMVDSQQNISDSDMQGEIMASKQPSTVFLRRAILPLMTFVLNQKTRIWSDIRTISNKVSDSESKVEAGRSLAGSLVELAVFSSMTYGFSELYNIVALAIMGEDEDDEDKKKRRQRSAASTAQNFMKDFFLPPLPGADVIASKGINYALEESGASEAISKNLFGMGDDEEKFRLYDRFNQGYLDMLGTQGIALEKAIELTEFLSMANDGTFTQEFFGNKVTKQLDEEDMDIARINAAIMSGYYGGLLPSDFARIAKIMDKKIKNRADEAELE